MFTFYGVVFIHCVKCARILVFSDPHFPVKGQNLLILAYFTHLLLGIFKMQGKLFPMIIMYQLHCAIVT